MRAGGLNRTITLLSPSAGVPDDYGTVTDGWGPAATLRAAVVSLSTEEFLKAFGEISTAVAVFRIRHRAGVSNAMRVQFEGRTFDVREVTEIGHRDGLELRCEEVRS